MAIVPAPEDVESFRELIAERLGLSFEEGKLEFLGDVLRRRMEETGCQRFSAYRGRVCTISSKPDELGALAEELTVGETYFFRYGDQFSALAGTVFPARIVARQRERRLRILSAGCASGEEPYSLAILLQERFPELSSWDVRILAFDVSPVMVRKALRGRYGSWSLRETSEDLRVKYFRREGRDFALIDEVRVAVSFECRNLVDEDPSFWTPGEFDVILCRNVTMYLTSVATRAVTARFAKSLAPEGFLFLGHAETLRGVSHDFHLRHTHETFYYQLREAYEGQHATEPLLGRDSFSDDDREPDRRLREANNWYSAIQEASERVTAITERQKAKGSVATNGPSADSLTPFATNLQVGFHRMAALDLVRREKFEEAKQFLKASASEDSRDADTQLLLAVVLANSGDLPAAEKTCDKVLRLDELNAGAHYVMALCREHARDVAAAMRHDEAASYLDSTFSMSHLHLGLMAKRSGNLEAAQTELGRALPLLEREDTSRVLLFGGGFTRDTLVELCRRELFACGGGK